MPKPEAPTMNFFSVGDWETWLTEHYEDPTGVWIRFTRKHSGLPTVTYQQAPETALCWGWIDGQVKRVDEQYYRQKFVPRRKGSLWSRVNREKALGLIADGRMTSAGLQAIAEAQANGRWEAAYEPASSATVPPDLAAALVASPTAATFFATLRGQKRYAILFRLQTSRTAKARASLLAKIITMLNEEQTFL